MAVRVKHKFTSPVADSSDSTMVQPKDWNADHDITMVQGNLLGRLVGADGVAQEIPIKVDAGKQSMIPPAGSTAARPALPANGMFRYNSTTLRLEGYQGGAWQNFGAGAIVSATAPTLPQKGDIWYDTSTSNLKVWNGTAWTTPMVSIKLDSFRGDGTKTAFTLTANPGSENNLSIFVGTDYVPKSTYSVTGTTLTFLVAPPAPPAGSGASFKNIEIEYLAGSVADGPQPQHRGHRRVEGWFGHLGQAGGRCGHHGQDRRQFGDLCQDPESLRPGTSSGSPGGGQRIGQCPRNPDEHIRHRPPVRRVGCRPGPGIRDMLFYGMAGAHKIVVGIDNLGCWTPSAGPAPYTYLQVGNADSDFLNSGYLGATSLHAQATSLSTLVPLHVQDAAVRQHTLNGVLMLEQVTGNRWAISATLGDVSRGCHVLGYAIDLGTGLDRVRVSIAGGEFSTGRVSCKWE